MTRYRLTRALSGLFSTPPPVKCLCTVWRRENGIVWLDATHESTCAEWRFPVSEDVFAAFFKEVEN